MQHGQRSDKRRGGGLATGAAFDSSSRRGTKHRHYLEENVKALEVRLSRAELDEIEAIFPYGAAAGERYAEAGMKSVNG